MKATTYNGWTNYATWRVALELNNNEETSKRLELIKEKYKQNQLRAVDCMEFIRDLHRFYFDTFPSRLQANFHEILTT